MSMYIDNESKNYHYAIYCHKRVFLTLHIYHIHHVLILDEGQSNEEHHADDEVQLDE